MDATTNLWSKLWTKATRYVPFQVVPINEDIKVAKASVSGQNTPNYHQSTFIQQINYDPNRRMVFIKMGKGLYYYPMTVKELSTWLRSKSLGQWYNEHLKLK